MDADILGHWELHIISKGYNIDADILGRQEPYIISKSYIDSKEDLIPIVESIQNNIQPRAKGNTAALKNRRVKSITLTGKEAGTKTLRQEGEGTKLSYTRR
jgi:hypothetical protein